MANDTAYQLFQHYGTNAERLAFTPSPAAGIQPLYAWYETDTNKEYVYTTAWHLVSSSGGNVTTSATLTANRLILGNGGVDVTLLGSLGTTTTLLHGNAAGAPTFAAVSLTADVSGVLPVANGGTGTASGVSLRTATVSLTNANVLGLSTGTAQTLVAAQGANTTIVPWLAVFTTNFTAGAYTSITNGDYLYVGLNGTETTMGYIANDNTVTPTLAELTNFLAATKRVELMTPYQRTYPTWGTVAQGLTSADAVNKDLKLAGVTSGAWGGGNAANGVTVTTYYTVVSTP